MAEAKIGQSALLKMVKSHHATHLYSRGPLDWVDCQSVGCLDSREALGRKPHRLDERELVPYRRASES